MTLRVVVGVVAGLCAGVLGVLGFGVPAVLAAVLAGGLLLPTSLFGGDDGDPFLDATGGGDGGGV